MLKKNVITIYRAFKWRWQLWKRSVIEYLQRFRKWNIDSNRKQPYVVYMTGMPRTGSSFMKNYLGDYPGLKIVPFEPRGFHISWQESIGLNQEIYVDKSTHYIRHLNKIAATCGDKVSFCCIVRDPRDQLASLFEFERHPELERNENFWKKWLKQYTDFINFASNHPSNNFFMIRYEDLVKMPISAKVQFLKWLNISLNKEVTENYKIAYVNDIQDDKVKSYTTASVQTIGRHQSIEEVTKQKIIAAYNNYPEVKQLMENFGYLPTLKPFPPQSFYNITFFDPNTVKAKSY